MEEYKIRIFTGTVVPLPNSGRPTGMFKKPVTGTADIGPEGFSGDEQADRRVHGGPEKAIHFYPADHYGRLASAFPDAAGQLVPGSLGENLSAYGLTEADTYLGDIFRLGTARLQVCQPRNPCWKIDTRFAAEGMAAHIASTGMTGWYFRVLQPGRAAPDDPLVLEERQDDGLSLAAIKEIWDSHRPLSSDLERIAATPGIAGTWRAKIVQRLEWLRR